MKAARAPMRLRKILVIGLVAGLFQPFATTLIPDISPKAYAATTYAPANATTFTVPSGVETITGTIIGGGGGNGATDGAGNTLRVPSGRGQVDFSLRPTAGSVIGIYPGYTGSSGATGTNTAGGNGGQDTDPNQNFNGGGGGRSGGSGSSGSGGGGGAASVLYIDNVLVAVAGGAGAGGGSANVALSGSDGSSTYVANGTNYNGAPGVAMSTACNASNDGGGGGGGGGGYYGGNGGNLISHTSECSGNGGTKGQEYVKPNVFSSSSTSLNNSSNTSNGSIALTLYLSTPANISASGGTSSISVNWNVASAAQGFTAKLYSSNGATLLATKQINSGTYTTTFTNSDYASITTNTLYSVSVTAKGNSGTPYIDSNESSKVVVSTSTPTETDTAISLDGSSNQSIWAPSHSSLLLNDTFTVQAWIQPSGFACQYWATSSSTGSDEFCHIVGKGNYFSFVIGSDTNYQYKNRLGVIWSGEVRFSSYIVKPGEWHHVAFTRNGSGVGQASIHVDGSLVETVTVGANSADNSRDFTIGSNRSEATSVNNSYGKFLGLIDEVKVSKVARTQSQIISDAHSHNLDSVFQLYYDFNETAGNRIFNRAPEAISATDLSVANGDGVFNSTSIWTTETVMAYTVVKFKRDYLVNSNGWRTPSNVNSIRFLAVGGGGGGGGGYNGGGGGAGGVRETNTAVTPNAIYNVVIGLPGLGALESYTNTSGGSTIFRLQSTQSEILKVSGGGRGATEQQAMGGPNGNPAGAESGGSGGGGVHGGGINTNGASGNTGGFTPVEGYSGGNGYSAAGYYVGGGGGGAGGGGGSATTSSPGIGGIGVSSFITGTEIKLGGGGGGSGRLNLNGEKVFTASGDAAFYYGGGAGACTSACTTVDTGTAGTANTGGGGGAGAASNGRGNGGGGGSGLLVIKYITESPAIIIQPVSDTSTVGASNTFSLVTSVAPTPLTKSIFWQFTSDTTTVSESSISGWTNVSSGSGFTSDTFTTSSLTKLMNKYRFRAIVSFSDTHAIYSTLNSSIVTLTVNDAISITSSTSTIIRKYGTPQTVRTISYTGGTTSSGAVGTSTSHKVDTPFGALGGGKIYVDTSTSTAYFKVDTGTAVGTYLETITVTDFKGAVALFTQNVIVTPADTLTVSAVTPASSTYTGTPAAVTPTFTVSGLVNEDSVSSVSHHFSRIATGNVTSYGPINTPPTNAGSYTITPSALTLNNGVSTGNYLNIIYETATLTINKATQTPFTNYSSLSAIFGTAFTIFKFGGSGDGDETLTVTSGTATNCDLTGNQLSATTVGSCLVTATKATSENFLQSVSTFTVHFYYYVPASAPTVSSTPTQIAIAVDNGWSANATVGPTISSISPTSGPIGTLITITGTGFNGVDIIKVGRKVLTSITGINSTTVSGVIPGGSLTGPIYIANSIGSDFNAVGFTVTP